MSYTGPGFARGAQVGSTMRVPRYHLRGCSRRQDAVREAELGTRVSSTTTKRLGVEDTPDERDGEEAGEGGEHVEYGPIRRGARREKTSKSWTSPRSQKILTIPAEGEERESDFQMLVDPVGDHWIRPLPPHSQCYECVVMRFCDKAVRERAQHTHLVPRAKPRRSPGHILMMGGDVRRNDVDELAEEGVQANRPPIALQQVADERGARSRREGLAQHRSL